MLVVFCVHIYSFAGSIRRTPPPTFSDPAITDRHSDPAIFQLRARGADILVYWIGKIVQTCVADGSQTLDFQYERRTPYPLGQTLLHVRETGDTVRHRVTVRRQQIRDIRTRMFFFTCKTELVLLAVLENSVLPMGWDSSNATFNSDVITLNVIVTSLLHHHEKKTNDVRKMSSCDIKCQKMKETTTDK